MNIDYQSKVSIPNNVICRELQGESVLLNLESERYFGLDEVGTRMWGVLSASDTIGQAYQTLLEEYDVETGQLQHDLDDLLQKLLEAGLIVVS